MALKKQLTGIDSFDNISKGGLPKGRTTLVAGSSGSAKTLFCAQFLAMGIQEFDEPGIFVTFEEQPEDIRNNLASFGWDIAAWEAKGKWLFIDASPKMDDTVAAGEYDLSAFRLRLVRAISKIKAKRVVIDSVSSAFEELPDMRTVRRELFKVAMELKQLNMTSLVTTERDKEYGSISRFGVEEFLTDNVIILRNVLTKEKRRRTIEILKFRGSEHTKGESPFTIVPKRGVVIIPLSAKVGKHKASKGRVTSGIPKIDKMCGGGFYRDSIILVSGATGAGKTLMVTSFVTGIANRKERCLLVIFEESCEQLYRNAKGWGQDFGKLEKDGILKVESFDPETVSLEDHFIKIQELILDFKPTRVAIDSLTTLVRTSSEKAFHEFMFALTTFLKKQQVTALFTATPPLLTGGISVTEDSVSAITDTIILLRYVEMSGEMQRSVAVLKMRGSRHDASIRRFTIDDEGMQIGEIFEGINGILTGNQVIIMERNNE